MHHECGKYTLMKVLGLTMKEGCLLLLTNSTEKSKQKLQETVDLTLELYTRAEQSVKINR